jgi:hypothetical protein
MTLAGTIARRIIKLRAECAVEVARAPASIVLRYAEREEKIKASADPEALRYLGGLLDAHYDEAEVED